MFSNNEPLRKPGVSAFHGDVGRQIDFDWQDFYDSWAGSSYFEFFRQDLETHADIVLLDSRTGITELGGVCTHHLADFR